MDGFKHLDLQQCEKFKEFGAPEFHHDCAKELEIHSDIFHSHGARRLT
ncbi:hypothetical protein GLYMA_03G060801v4 [Glycine max]|nr:hypothetical protein GLYMA_03G060801v4 [Glycine max]